MITRAETEGYRRRLLNTRRQISGEVARLKEQPSYSLAGEPGVGVPGVGAYLADVESAGLEDLELTFLQHQEGLLEECNAALARIEAGTFGRCEECGRPIAKGRLQVFPFARCCLGCARRREGRLGA